MDDTFGWFLLVGYFIPTFTALYCYYFGWAERRQRFEETGRMASWPYWKGRTVRATLYVNLLFGWTIIGWFWAWRIVWKRPENLGPLGSGPVPTSSSSTPGPAQAPPPGPWPQPETAASPRTCTTCGGSGKVSCMSCGGQGGRWQQPQTESGTSQWVPCTYCTSSGYITCSTCGGRGAL